MSYNIIHDNGGNPQTWNNILANDVRANSASIITIDSADMYTNTIVSNSVRTANLLFPPYAPSNTMTKYYYIKNTNLTLPQLLAPNDKVDVIYEQIGRQCTLSILATSADAHVSNRRFVNTTGSGVINTFLNNLGSDIASLIYDGLANEIVPQGTGFYLTGVSPETRKTFYWNIIKGTNASNSYIEFVKEDYVEGTGMPAWLTTDRLFSIIISYNYMN
jgi:hypothetical protein